MLLPKFLRWFCWLLFFGALLFLRVRSFQANRHQKVYDIVRLELADSEEGRFLLNQWSRLRMGNGTLIDYARLDTRVDFLFIIGYTGVLLMISSRLRKKQQRPVVGALLRGCGPLALLAGLLDVIENLILLADLRNYADDDSFVSSQWAAYPKFGLIVLVLAIWLLALLLKPVKGRRETFKGAD